MAEDKQETDKTVRLSLESLVIKVTNDELKYREKYLPDPRRLSNDKIVCTVCSVSLASRVRKGKDIYIHAILGVLVCKDCHRFYGDGIFSTDEDGDDKYCRWCGQGGTLYLCSRCNCGFCKKCMTKNMKNSALAEIEKDDWKCLICIPRPIFGSRAVCWASQELNRTVRKNHLTKRILEEEKLTLEAESKLAVNEEETINASVKRSGKANKRLHDSEDSDSSTVFIPAKKPKRDAKTNKSLNGSVKKHRRKNEYLSSDSELSHDDHSSKWEKRKRKTKNKRQSLSSGESSATSKKKKKKGSLKKKTKTSSDESSDTEEIIPKYSKTSHKKSVKSKRKKKLSKEKKVSSSDSSSNESVEKPRKKKKTIHSKRKSSSDSSSGEDTRKSNSKEEQDIVHGIDYIKGSDGCGDADADAGSIDASYKVISNDEVNLESVGSITSKLSRKELDIETADDEENKLLETSEIVEGNETLPIENSSKKSLDLVNELQTSQSADQPGVIEGLSSSEQNQSLIENEYTLSYHGSTSCSDENLPLSQEDEVKVKVHLAIEWLDIVSSDIADLGSLIAERTNKFGERKVNLENLQSYEDVISTLEKLKQLLGGIHTNYKQIEDSLEDKLKSWKILAGLEKCDLEEQLYEEADEIEIHAENELSAGNEIPVEGCVDTQVDDSELQLGDEHSEPNKTENECHSEVDSSILPKEDKSPTADLNITSTAKDCKVNYDQDNENKNIVPKDAQDNFEKENMPETINEALPNHEITLERTVNVNEVAQVQELESEGIDNALVKAKLNHKSGSSNMVWSGLLSSEDDSDLNDEIVAKLNSNGDNTILPTEDQGPELDEAKEKNGNGLFENHALDEINIENEISHGKEEEREQTDAANFEALQELLDSSTEPDIGSSESDSDGSSDLQLDDSDLDDILKPRKVIVKKATKRRESKVEKETNEDLEVKPDDEEENQEVKPLKMTEAEKKAEEPLDSEAEIDMLTDLSKLKKKTVLKRVEQEESSEESSSEESSDDDGNEDNQEKKRRKKYNNEIKKKREQERNELFGFLQGDSSAEDEVDITKNDLDVMEDQYVSESSDSMTLEEFSRKMNEKWRELENEQDQLNLQMLLASDSDQGSSGGDDIVLDSGEEEKKKKGKKGKTEKIKEDEADKVKETEADTDKETDIKVKEEKEEAGGPDLEYEQFLEGFVKNRTTFTGLGSSSEEDKDCEEIDVKEEALSDSDTKVKKEPRSNDENSSSNSDSSADLFLDLTKKKSQKKLVWRQHKLLKMKLSDTDTSDEERWWQRRLEREKKKKELGDSDSSEFDEFAQALSSKKSHGEEQKKKGSGSDKENKKIKREKRKEDEKASSSSTLEMSSTDSSGSEIFKKKKKKKRETSDSDVMILSDGDKKKKKKKKRMNLSGDSSDESGDSDDDVIDITQKSSQGESPGKGGRKNIRKVLTKHELAAATKAAAKEEEERKKRIAARQKMFNEMFEIKEAEVLEKLVLDFDPETKTELISVDKDLVTKMKPHQAKGVKFMWDSCFESLSQLKTKKGSGCILAHCMGLGKTFQVVSLVHTILRHKDTNVRTVLVVCPLSTVLNWFTEFDKWLEDVSGGRNIKIYHLTKFKKAHERSRQLSLWHRTGGVMILGYEMFRILANPNSKQFRLMHSEIFQKTLIDPGADLVVCDEGHMLKNESTLLSKAMSRIRTLRRIVLTGTPMQNNLKEYHCMVQFVKPNLLGTRKEFLNQFVNPITNGQFVDSTEADVKVMKRRAHVLHKMLEGLVQRFDYSVLTPFLPPKHEYVISLRLSDVQVKLYQFYLDYFCQKKSDDKRTSSQLFQDWQVLGRIWTHPRVLKMSTDKAEKEKQEASDSEGERKKLRSQRSIKDFFKKKECSSSGSSKQESEDEGSIKDFINDKSSSSSLSLSSSSDDENGEKKDKTKKEKKKKKTENGDKEQEKKETPVTEVPAAKPFDEINLISSEEEDESKKEESNEVKEIQKTDTNNENENKANENENKANENENKANDSGIEDQDAKPEDEPTVAVEKTMGADPDKADPDNNGEEESKEDEKKENLEKNEREKKRCEVEQLGRRGAWWKDIIEPEHLEDINQSAKLVLLFAILRECEMIEDKVLVFSQSLFSLDLIEYFLEKVDRATEENRLDESLGNHAGCWQKGLDYFRLDGSSSSESRSAWCKSFNKDDNPRARLFLISTRAGGLGINLTGANRVVIFDASWNPSHDIQSIFRIYRFGQKKPCYVYRFVAHGTMEEKVYDRQVAKQLLSSRVVDEQQVHRHFSMNDLNELYTFTPPQERTEKPTPVLPKDRLMAEMLKQYNDWIEKYHEHDSLLENIAEEELNEEERKLAWEDYENEKKGGFPPPAPGTGVPNFPEVANQIELFRKSLRLKFPNATESEMNAMLQTLMYQVNLRAVSQQVPQQQQGQHSNAGPSQPNSQKFSGTFRNTNSINMGSYQPFSQMVEKMNREIHQKPMQQQRIGTNQMNQQRMGNGLMNQQRMGNGLMNQQRMGNRLMNQQMVGNGQIRKTNRTSEEIYMEQMRKQQQVNLDRIQNQRKFQQQGLQSNPGQQSSQQRNIVRQQPLVGNRLPPTQLGQNIWKSAQPVPVNQNRLQQIQKQQQKAINILSPRARRQVTPIRNNVKPVVSNQQPPQRKSSQQNMKEQMQKRIEELKRKMSHVEQKLQSKEQQKVQKGGPIDPAQRKQLEEMKKRYNASRMKQNSGAVSTPISIVEIDDEPGT